MRVWIVGIAGLTLAIVACVKIVEKPDHGIVERMEQAVAKARVGDHAGAIQDFTVIIALDPQSAEAHAHRGFSRAALGDRSGAAEDFERPQRIVLARLQAELEDKPDNLDLRFRIAFLLSDLGEHSDAIVALQQAVASNPSRTESHFELGNALARAGDPASAIDSYDVAIMLAPGDYRAYVARARAKQALGDTVGAGLDFDAAQNRVPGDQITGNEPLPRITRTQ